MKHKLAKLLILPVALLLCISSLTAASGWTPEKAKKLRLNMVAQAKTYLGTPYVTGGTTSKGMDCSGFIVRVIQDTTGKSFPRTVAEMYSKCQVIKDNEKEAGDLIFFKTVGFRVSHVGMYIGKGQFIHSASDGSRTGVIISSLDEKYWKEHYHSVGRFVPSGLSKVSMNLDSDSENSDPDIFALFEENSFLAQLPDLDDSTAEKGVSAGSSRKFMESVGFDISASLTTSLMTRSDIMLNARGFDSAVTALFDTGKVKPGVGLGFRYDARTHVFQIPITATVSTSDFLRFYIGPVISMGKAVVPGSTDACKASFFPGIIGLSLQTPSILKGKTGLHFIADTNYIVYNKIDGSALSLLDSFITGFTINTGIRVTLPRA